MTSFQQKGLSSSRIKGPPLVNVDLLECPICHDVLWKPVACQFCETPFCSACINRWLTYNPNNCPNRCSVYMERKCPPFIVKLLAPLNITCFYHSRGCQQVISYEALDQHEIECDYQPQQCPGCRSEILKKDFDNHTKNCALIELNCQDCKFVYKRGDAAMQHTENICLREQLRQLRDESKENKREIHELTLQLKEVCILNPSVKNARITFEDLPNYIENWCYISSIYRGLKWAGIAFGHQLYFQKHLPESGFTIAFNHRGSQNIDFFENHASIDSQCAFNTFNFVSLTACAAWNDDLQLTTIGYRNSIEINKHTTTLLFGKPQLILFNWKGIDKITFKSSGGTAHPGSGGSGLHVVIAQLTIGPHN